MTRLALLALLLVVDAIPADDTKPVKPVFPGPTATGFLLPNGWHLTPAGKHLITTDLPLNIVPLKDGKRLLVATSGFNQHDLSLVDVSGDEPKLVAKESARQSWYGLAVNKDESKVWWSGGGQAALHTFDLSGDKFARTSPKDADLTKMSAAELAKLLAADPEEKKPFRSGLALHEPAGVLYSLDINGSLLSAVKLADGSATSAKIGGRPYNILVGPDGNLLYFSDWAGRQVLTVDPVSLRVLSRIPVGENPNQMALHPKDGRLYIACASSNCVSVIDTKRGVVTETFFTALFPKSPEGSTPDAVAVSQDGQTLYVANADNNCIAVIDIAKPNKSGILGFIPTGWYPTAVASSPDGKSIYIGVGKGLQSKANPLFTPEQLKAQEKDEMKAISRRLMPYPYIGTTMAGAVSVVPVPDEAKLKEYTAQVYRNCPYSDVQLATAPHPQKTAIPTTVGDPSPIRHVIYVIKENRTYDQVFGDLAAGANPVGNGDPKLCMFPRKVTPNHHKLAEEFVLLDNLYCNGQVSRDGHPWSTAAYHTDYIARDWHLTYSRRKGVDDDDDGDLQNPPSGYLWDACKQAGLSYRSYGEYGKRVSDGMGGTKFEGRVPGLIGHTSPTFGLPTKENPKPRDTDRVEQFLAEFRQYEKRTPCPGSSS